MAGTPRGFGINVSSSDEVITQTAKLAEELGYVSLWSNNTPGSDGVATLAKAAKAVSTLDLGVGVIPVASHSPDDIAQRYSVYDAEGTMPYDRVIIGIGVKGKGALDQARESIARLRELTPARIYLAALGPKMCRLAGELADGVLFNWLTPDYAKHSADLVREGAEAAGRETPTVMTYVRTALGDEAYQKVLSEGARYNKNPAYNAHFKRMGVAPEETAITGSTPEEIQKGLAAWEGAIDSYIVRAITINDSVDEHLALVRAGAPKR